MGKHAIYQHLALAVVNLIFSTLWVTRKVVLYAYNIMIYEIKLQKLTPLSGEGLQDKTSNNSIKERVDIRTRGFWEWGQQTFFDLWVLDPNACRCRKKSLQQCYATNEHEKKRVCNEGILEKTMIHLHPWCFQSTVVWEESVKSFTCVWHKSTWKERPSVIDFK